MPAYNTDNMGKLFVTLFAFAPALKTALYRFLHLPFAPLRVRASARNLNSAP
jgi:hypothetical protein